MDVVNTCRLLEAASISSMETLPLKISCLYQLVDENRLRYLAAWLTGSQLHGYYYHAAYLKSKCESNPYIGQEVLGLNLQSSQES